MKTVKAADWPPFELGMVFPETLGLQNFNAGSVVAPLGKGCKANIQQAGTDHIRVFRSAHVVSIRPVI